MDWPTCTRMPRGRASRFWLATLGKRWQERCIDGAKSCWKRELRGCRWLSVQAWFSHRIGSYPLGSMAKCLNSGTEWYPLDDALSLDVKDCATGTHHTRFLFHRSCTLLLQVKVLYTVKELNRRSMCLEKPSYLKCSGDVPICNAYIDQRTESKFPGPSGRRKNGSGSPADF